MPATYELPRYCGRCGEIFEGRTGACPECGGVWPSTLPENLLACYALLLTEIQGLRRSGEISETVFATLRRVYEARLVAVRPARKPKPVPSPLPRPQVASVPPPPPPTRPLLVSVAAAVTPRPQRGPFPAAPVRPPAPPKPPSHVRRDMYNWAARRQADLVLYLGAFLLTISALIFVSYQGSGMSGIAKSGLFGAYTSIFLVLGLQLRKWKRVQEAGPIFLALGAVLAPLNFVALYTNVLRGESIAQEFVWLAGSLSTGALYGLFAYKGFGKLYWLPAGGSFFAAYASLGACLQLPDEWYGPWFMGLAVAANFAAPRLPRFRGDTEAGAYALGALSLAFTHTWVAFEGGHHAALPAVHALAFAGICRSAFPSLRPLFIGVLPVFAVSTAATTAWAIEPWQSRSIDWAPAWLLALAAAYLLAGRLKPSLSDLWASLSGATAAAAIGLAHLMVLDGEIAWRLPLAYAGGASIAAAWFSERRYAASLLALPAALAAAAAASCWAADRLAFEWLGSFVAAAGAGYLVVARYRGAEAPAWRMLAGACGGLALVLAHTAAVGAGIQRWELPVVYGITAAGAAFDAFRFRASSLAAGVALAIGGAAALWALEVSVAYWAFPALALGVAIVATEMLWRRDADLAELAWPMVALLALSPLLALDALVGEPWVGAANFTIAATMFFAMAFRTNGAIVASAGFTSARAVRIERQMLARFGSWSLFAALGFVEAALEFTPVEAAWSFAGIGAACWLGVALWRGRLASFEEVAGPVGLTAFAVALGTVQDLGHATLIAGVLAAAAALATGGRYAMAWRAAYASGALLTLALGHGLAAGSGVEAWQLPAAYGFVLAALLWDSAWNRFQPAMLFVPAVAAAGATTLAWWQEWPLEHHAWAPLGIALAIAVSERLWKRSATVAMGAWPYVLVLSLAPVLLVETYRDAAWPGAAAFALATAAWTIACFRSNGALGRLVGLGTPSSKTNERQAIAVGAFGLLLATIGQGAFALEVAQHHAAWALAGASFASWAAIVLLRTRSPLVEEVLGPASLAGVICAVFASYPNHGNTAMIVGAATVAASLTVAGRFQHSWRVGYALAGGASILFAHNQGELVGREAWELPAAYGLVLAALLWDSARNRFQIAMLAVPGVAAAAATSFGWWQEWPLEHLVWAPLGIALCIAASERLWQRGQLVRQCAWPYVLALALAPIAVVAAFIDAATAGAGAFALAAVAWGITAWRSNGALSALLATRTEAAIRGERHLVAFGAYAFGLVALGFANSAAGIALEDAAWTFGTLGIAALFLTAWRRPELGEWRTTLTVAGVAAGLTGLGASAPHGGQIALMLSGIAGGLLASGLANRSSARIVTAAVLASLCTAFAWAWADWPLWSLALSFGVAAAVLFAALAPARKNGSDLRAAVAFLSVAPMMLSVLLAVFAVFLRDLEPGAVTLVRTAEWASLAAIVLIAGLMLVGEGLYRQAKLTAFAGTAVILLAVELAVAMLQIENIQVHTAPIALYVIGLGLAIRRSDPLFGQNMYAHEALLVLGSAILVLPPAAQSFSPGGEDWGLFVIVLGLGLLASGLALFQRWLVVPGVVTLVGVAARYIFDNTSSGTIPYWVTLGLAGLALLGVGVLMLLERDWWDRTKARIGHWWLEPQDVAPQNGG